jgi:hypothetical protein
MLYTYLESPYIAREASPFSQSLYKWLIPTNRETDDLRFLAVDLRLELNLGLAGVGKGGDDLGVVSR